MSGNGRARSSRVLLDGSRYQQLFFGRFIPYTGFYRVLNSVLSQKFVEKVKAVERHCRGSGNPIFFEFPGFRVALPSDYDPGVCPE